MYIIMMQMPAVYCKQCVVGRGLQCRAGRADTPGFGCVVVWCE